MIRNGSFAKLIAAAVAAEQASSAEMRSAEPG